MADENGNLIDDIWKSRDENIKQIERVEAAYQDLIAAIAKFKERTEAIEKKLDISQKNQDELNSKIDKIDERVIAKFSDHADSVREIQKQNEDAAAALLKTLQEANELLIVENCRWSIKQYAAWGAGCGLVIAIVFSILAYVMCLPIDRDRKNIDRMYYNQDYGYLKDDTGNNTNIKNENYIYYYDSEDEAAEKRNRVVKILANEGRKH